MAYALLTNLIFEPKGKHDPSLTYTIKDTVMSDDGSKVYFALKDVPAGIPLTDTEYWILQMDLSSSKNAMDSAAATAKTQTDAVTKSAQDRVDSMVDTAADAIANLNDYTKQYGLRVRGETHKASGNPIKIYPDAGSLFNPVTTIKVTQEGSGDPYPAGGGKNLLNYDIWKTTYVEKGTAVWENYGVTLTATGNDCFTDYGDRFPEDAKIPVNEGDTITLSWETDSADRTGSAYIFPNGGTNGMVSEHNISNNKLTYTAGAGVTFVKFRFGVSSSGDTISYKNIQIEKGSEATDFQPYSNIRPIIGYDKLDLTRAGKNLLPNTATTQTINGVTFTMNEDGSVTVNGTATEFTTIQISSSESFDLPNGDYILSGCPDGGSEDVPYALAFWNTDGADGFAFNKRGDTPFTFTNEDGNYNLSLWINTGETYNSLIFKPMIRPASYIDATYAPYVGTLHTVQIGQTVYGIRYEWLTGKGMIEWAGHVFDGTEDIVAQDDYGSFYTPNEPLGAGNSLCSHAWARGNEWFLGGGIAFITGLNRVIFYNSLFGASNRDEFVAILAAQHAAGTPVQIVYKLVTPIEIQLAPTAVLATETEGVNYIYGDGDIEVEYVIPLKQSIAKRVNMLLDTFAEPFEKTGDIVTCEPVAGIEFDSVVSTIEPQQSGSGDPYPAGGGKNLLVDVTVFDTVWLKGVISLTAGITYTLSVQETADALYFSNEGGTVDYATAYNAKHLTYTPETSGIHVLFARYANGADLAYNMMLEKGSAATEYAPPSNIRPIIGYDALGLMRHGKNLISPPKNNFSPTADFEYSEDSGVLKVIKTADAGVDRGQLYYELEVDASRYAGQMITLSHSGFSCTYSGESPVILLYNQDASVLIAAFYIAEQNSKTAQLPADCTKLRIVVRIDDANSAPNGTVLTLNGLQLEVGSTPSAFAPYHGNLHTVQIGQTVYGIRYEWLTGKGMIEWAGHVFDGTEDIVAQDDYGSFYTPNEPLGAGNSLCSHAWARGNEWFLGGGIAFITGLNRVIFYNSLFGASNRDEFVAILAAQHAAGTPVQIVYKLVTPIEIHLTPTEIIALSGVNNLYGSGKTTVAGRQSKDVDILRRLTTLETLLTNQTKGE